MAYLNFKKTFWSRHITTEIEKSCVLASGCDYRFEGEIAKGKSLRILGVGRPAINDYTGASQTAETVSDSSIEMDINFAKNYFFQVGDIDKIQGQAGLMEALTLEGNQGLAEARDSAIAALAAQARMCSSATAAVDTEAEAYALIRAAFKALYEKGIKKDERLELILDPNMYMLMEDKITALSTDNPAMIRSGLVGIYRNAEVLMTNNLYVDASGYTYSMLRTKKAMAFAGQISDVEPTDLKALGILADAVLAVDVFGVKLVRQNEVYVMKHKET